MTNFITKQEAIIILQGHIIKNRLFPNQIKMSDEECSNKIAQLNSLSEDDGNVKCNADDPNDPHYGDYGAYTTMCLWIWF